MCTHVFHLILFVINLFTIDTGIESMKSIECDTTTWLLVSYELLKCSLTLSIRHQVQTTWTLLVVVVLIGTSIQANADYKKSTNQSANVDEIILELDIYIYVRMRRRAKLFMCQYQLVLLHFNNLLKAIHWNLFTRSGRQRHERNTWEAYLMGNMSKWLLRIKIKYDKIKNENIFSYLI